ncbi:MAG: hypothetical protein AB2693_31040 [Candidatus Thiodiazotropha sp.]
MAESEFNKAGDRSVYEDLNLKEQDRKRIETISKRQRSELKRLRRQQSERWERDMAMARKKVSMQHNRPRLKPGWDKGGPLPKGKIEQLAYRSVKSKNRQELNLLNAQFEKEKNDIISRSFLQDRDAITKSREQRKRDRKVTRYRSRSRDTEDRGR